ncbi:MAG: FlgD immunoglobulin-like domain containing protein [candidate division KSB1 bacterium]
MKRLMVHFMRPSFKHGATLAMLFLLATSSMSLAQILKGSAKAPNAFPFNPNFSDSPGGVFFQTPPYTQSKTHEVGNIRLTITNFGELGGRGRGPSGEFPAHSNIEHLFTAALWIGALVDNDTLVSFGFDGWQSWNELFPGFTEQDSIHERTNRSGFPHYDPLAISEEDFIAVYADTNRSFAWEGHHPLGLEITQKSYAWSRPGIEDFVILEYRLRNLSARLRQPKTFHKVILGLYVDGDCGHTSVPNYFADDVTGFSRVALANDTLAVAWIKDDDGDNGLTPSLAGMAALNAKGRAISFNWWDPASNWGPSNLNNPSDYSGHPDTDAKKYRIMSNREIDPNSNDVSFPPDFGRGIDIRYLLSVGPYELAPDSTRNIAFAYVGGEPVDASTALEDLLRNAESARNVYQNSPSPPQTGALQFATRTPAGKAIADMRIRVQGRQLDETLRTNERGEAALQLLYDDYTVSFSRWGFYGKMLPLTIAAPRTELAPAFEPGYIETFTAAQTWSLRDTSDRPLARQWAISPVANLGSSYLRRDYTGDAEARAAVSAAFRGTLTLTSPVMDASEMADPHVRFARYYNVSSDPDALDTLRVALSNDDGATWRELALYTAPDSGWRLATFRVADFLTPTAQMKVRFVNSENADAAAPRPAYCMIDDFILVAQTAVAVEERNEARQPEWRLAQNYPNPFNPSTTVSFSLAKPARVSLRIYDVQGRLVRTLVEEHREPGAYSQVWEGRDDAGALVASGLYLLRLQANEFVEIRKLALLH